MGKTGFEVIKRDAKQAGVFLALSRYSEQLLLLTAQGLGPPTLPTSGCCTIPDGGPTYLLKVMLTVHVYGMLCDTQGCVQHALI